jgi:hypothetical protein
MVSVRNYLQRKYDESWTRHLDRDASSGCIPRWHFPFYLIFEICMKGLFYGTVDTWSTVRRWSAFTRGNSLYLTPMPWISVYFTRFIFSYIGVRKIIVIIHIPFGFDVTVQTTTVPYHTHDLYMTILLLVYARSLIANKTQYY